MQPAKSLVIPLHLTGLGNADLGLQSMILLLGQWNNTTEILNIIHELPSGETRRETSNELRHFSSPPLLKTIIIFWNLLPKGLSMV